MTNSDTATKPDSTTEAAGQAEFALLAWIEAEIEAQEAARDSINIEHPEAEMDCYRMHDEACLRLEQLKTLVGTSKELWKALDQLVFECDGVVQTQAPTRETYNRAFSLKDGLKAKFAS